MFKFKPPRIRNPFKSQVNLRVLQKKLFQKKKKISWRTVGKYALWSLGIFLLIIVFLFAWFAKDLPTPGKIKRLVSASSTRLFDRNMKPLYTISGERKRILLDEKDIPESIKQATVALEDKNFYNHPGIDVVGLTRAVVYGGRRGGGSTITQQFVKNALLTSERTIVRKIKEAILAIELEALFSKEQILAMYLNEIPYGGNNYGVEAASRSFYNKPASELTLAEAATLASLPQAPTTLSPYGPNTDRLLERRNFTIDQMKNLGFISDEEAQAAKESEMAFAPRRDSIIAPHFVLYVKDWLVQYFTEELKDAQLAEQKVEEGGFTVITTLELEKQLIAEEVLSRHAESTLRRVGASNAGLVSIDPKRGEIIAMVGSVDYFNEAFGAFNVTTALRQPGSSFKPLVYAASFKEKYNPAFHLFDLPTDFGNYKPDNYDGAFRGPISIRNALGNSLNIPAVKILSLVGIEKALKTAHDMGITTLNDPDRYGLSLVLGGGEVKLLDLTTAYGVFANGGVLVPTVPVLKIIDSEEKEIYTHEEPKDARQVIDPQAAYQITSVLSDAEAKRPTFSRSLSLLTLRGRPSATKTGTTDAFRDGWTVGYTPQFVTGVWAGNNDNTPMIRGGGSTAAAPIWDDYMERVHTDLPVEQFTRPAGIREVTVDRLSNKLPVDGSDPITDVFASWQVPKDNDDVHIRVRVCKENGLLADSSIPDELAEEKTFVNIRSERPDNPNWEGPVQAWAASQGLNNRPPTEKCQLDNVRPTVAISSPTNNQEVTGTITINVTASAQSGVRQVDFLVDSIFIGSDTQTPYSVNYDTKQLTEGTHKITARVISNNGSTASVTINIVVKKDTTPPGNVSGLSCISDPGSGKATLSWTNPTDPDFSSVKIYIYHYPSLQQARSPVEVPKPGTNATISSLAPGAYKFTVKSVDANGNESSGVSCILTII